VERPRQNAAENTNFTPAYTSGLDVINAFASLVDGATAPPHRLFLLCCSRPQFFLDLISLALVVMCVGGMPPHSVAVLIALPSSFLLGFFRIKHNHTAGRERCV
jgi:hypothetical protein